MIFIKLLLSGILGQLRRLFGFAAKYPWQAALIASLAMSGWLYMGKQHYHAKADDEHAKFIAERKARDVDLASYASAQKEAEKLNAAEVLKIETERKEFANDKDTEIRSTVDRAITDARRVWAARTAQGVASRAQAGQAASAAVDPVGASAMPVMDAEGADIEDMLICTKNTVKAFEWPGFYGGLDNGK
jgi:glucose-6-phosphate-specific signal transduction histidine kinase